MTKSFKSFKKIGQESVGLVPVVVQDKTSRKVLMVAYMNKKAFEQTLRTGQSHFYSRSKNRLWRKGEISGHTQAIREIYVDCDTDTLLLEVDQNGVACHTGRTTCFFTRFRNGRLLPTKGKSVLKANATILENVFNVIQDRKVHPSKASYVSGLLAGGEDRVLKKVGEEAGEFLIASKNKKKSHVVHEAADLLFHVLVALNYQDIPLQSVFTELARRFGTSGLEEKKRRLKK